MSFYKEKEKRGRTNKYDDASDAQAHNMIGHLKSKKDLRSRIVHKDLLTVVILR